MEERWRGRCTTGDGWMTRVEDRSRRESPMMVVCKGDDETCEDGRTKKNRGEDTNQIFEISVLSQNI